MAFAEARIEMIDAPEHLQPIVPNTDGDAGNGDAISLSLADLLPDSGGAIVIEGDGGDLSIRIMTDEAVVDAGVVETLVTATGEDVSGHAFFSFSNGTTLYAPREMDLLIVNIDV
ncbi:hypothetical protein [Dongia sp.]|uniref:hypothetical protein n=1 Tax=Dongia sp. TaxID=1977262 RepID=UPI0035B0B017